MSNTKIYFSGIAWYEKDGKRISDEEFKRHVRETGICSGVGLATHVVSRFVSFDSDDPYNHAMDIHITEKLHRSDIADNNPSMEENTFFTRVHATAVPERGQ